MEVPPFCRLIFCRTGRGGRVFLLETRSCRKDLQLAAADAGPESPASALRAERSDQELISRRYRLGAVPLYFLKTREKYSGSEKPTELATSLTLRALLRSKAQA